MIMQSPAARGGSGGGAEGDGGCAGCDNGGGLIGRGDEENIGKHIFQPERVYEPSETHVIRPSTGMTPDGPVDPQYFIPAIVTWS